MVNNDTVISRNNGASSGECSSKIIIIFAFYCKHEMNSILHDHKI